MIKTLIIKHASKIGAGLAALAGVGRAFNDLSKVTYPDNVGNKNMFERYLWLIQHGGITLAFADPATYPHYEAFGGINYFKYKFFGNSAWVIPFWASLAVFIGAKVACYFGVAPGIAKPIEGISKGALIVSTIGALFLPGTGSGELAGVIADGVTEALTLS